MNHEQEAQTLRQKSILTQYQLEKEALAERSGLHPQTINNCLSSLTSKNILIRIGVGYYRINPRYVWKKSSGERDKMLKYILEVECKNC